MGDFLTFLYEQYIYPYVESWPTDDGDTHRCSAWACGISPDQREDGEAVIRFYAVHAFLLGLRTGAAEIAQKQALLSSGRSASIV